MLLGFVHPHPRPQSRAAQYCSAILKEAAGMKPTPKIKSQSLFDLQVGRSRGPRVLLKLCPCVATGYKQDAKREVKEDSIGAFLKATAK